jgi:hypothetical protein
VAINQRKILPYPEVLKPISIIFPIVGKGHAFFEIPSNLTHNEKIALINIVKMIFEDSDFNLFDLKSSR